MDFGLWMYKNVIEMFCVLVLCCLDHSVLKEVLYGLLDMLYFFPRNKIFSLGLKISIALNITRDVQIYFYVHLAINKF